jgi:hypothetical protein
MTVCGGRSQFVEGNCPVVGVLVAATWSFRDFRPGSEEQLQVPPLRCASVGMTVCGGRSQFVEGNCPVVGVLVVGVLVV